MSALKRVMHFYVHILIFFSSTEFCAILTQFDVIQGVFKFIFRLRGKNIPS